MLIIVGGCLSVSCQQRHPGSVFNNRASVPQLPVEVLGGIQVLTCLSDKVSPRGFRHAYDLLVDVT